MKLKYLLIFALILNISCVPKIKNFSAYQKQPILKSKFIDKKDLQKKQASVVVLNFNNRDNKIAEKADLGNALAVATENILMENKLIKLQDRNAFKKLEKEIILSEMSDSDISYAGPTKADFAISGDVSTAGFEHKFIAAKPSYDPSTGRISRTAPKHKYRATFTGNLKIYELPSLEVKEVIPLTGAQIRTEDAIENRSWLINTKIDTSAMKKEDDDLVRQAAISALTKNKHILKNIFSSYRKAFILEKRSNGKQAIFKISLGKNSGLKHGQKVKIFTKLESENPLTEEKYIENQELGRGVVSNIITERSAWIIVKDQNIAGNIKIGDYVTVIFKRALPSYIPSNF